MKHLKLTVLLAVTAAALFAAAGASATTLTGAGETTLGVGTEIKAESEGALSLHPPFGTISCNKASIAGKISNAGGSTSTVQVTLETFTESECNATITVLKKGTLEIHTQSGSANSNGTVTWTGTELTTVFAGFHCIFSTNNTDIGTLTGSATTKGNATLDIAATIPRTGGSSGAFCGATAQWTGSLKFTSPTTLNVDGGTTPPPAELTGEAATGQVGSTSSVTWKNDSESSMTIDDETVSDETVAKLTGTACGTIAATGSCTTRKVECLKAGEVTLTARDTPSIEAQVKVKCDAVTLTGEVPTPLIGETVTVTWKNDGESAITIEDETNSDSSVAETIGTSCGAIAATGSCTNRKLKCLKAGEVTLTARDTPSIEGTVKVKCHAVPVLTGKPLTMVVGEPATSITWENGGETSLTIDDEVFSSETVIEKSGTGCTTIAATSSCTSRKVKCLKKGVVTVTARDTPSVEGQLTITCHDILEGGPTTANVGETVTVTWTNNSGSSVLIEDEGTSDGTVAETLGTSCGTIASKASCTSRKIKCLKKGESTITAVDTPSIEGKFVIKCD